MRSDIEIADSAVLEDIGAIAERAGIDKKYVECYGSKKAKIDLGFLKANEGKKDGKLILVTAITPTPLGEGKTTTTIGLGDGLRRIGKKAVLALREPRCSFRDAMLVWSETTSFSLLSICTLAPSMVRLFSTITLLASLSFSSISLFRDTRPSGERIVSMTGGMEALYSSKRPERRETEVDRRR